jgi:hypothetical protein
LGRRQRLVAFGEEPGLASDDRRQPGLDRLAVDGVAGGLVGGVGQPLHVVGDPVGPAVERPGVGPGQPFAAPLRPGDEVGAHVVFRDDVNAERLAHAEERGSTPPGQPFHN